MSRVKNILIADDDQSICNVLQRILQDNGYQVFMARNGKEAVEITQTASIDVALIDIQMPEMDGIQALKNIKNSTKNTEVLIITGYPNLENLRKTIVENGAFDYLLKPFRLDEILRTVRNALSKQNYLRQNTAVEDEVNDRIAQLENDFEQRTRELRESQIKYSEIIENSNDIILVVQDEKLRFANRKAADLTGYSQEHMLNISFTQLIAPEDRSIVEETCLQQLNKKDDTNTYTFRVLRKDGTLFWVEAASKRTIWEERPALLSFLRDISARKRSQSQLVESEERYRTAIEHSNDGVAFIQGDRLLYVNQKLVELFGYDLPEEIVGNPFSMLVHSDDRERVTGIVLRRQKGEPVSSRYEWKGVGKDGKLIWIEASTTQTTFRGEAVYLAWLRDVSERKVAEEKLQKAHTEIESLISSLSSIIIGLSPDNRIIRWSKMAENVLGVSSETVLGQPFEKCGIQWNWELINENIAQCKREERPIRVDDIRFRNSDGKDRFLGITINPVKGSAEALPGLSIIGADVTDRKILEAQLIQAQKLESIGQLAAGIAHEINTPTQYVGDNTRFLQDAFKDLGQLMGKYDALHTAIKAEKVDKDILREVDEKAEEVDVDYLMAEIPVAIQQTLEGVSRIAKIVLAMKDFSHPGSLKKTSVDINRAIESTITVARSEWKYVAEMVTDFDISLPPVPCLPGEFNQVILNMIINAAHAIADVVGDGASEKGIIIVGTRGDGDWVEIRISDTGTGIPEDIRPRIFDPFFTTKEVGKGTGQGLAISHSVIVEKHGGTVSFESETGKGTTFIIRLPITNEETQVDTRKEETNSFC